MVNFYGAGKAFNLRYQQNNYRMMPRPGFQHAQQKAMLFGCHGHHHCGPQNVTINQGPQGFWGFMSGLFGGLFGGGMMGGMLGGFGPFNQVGGMAPYGGMGGMGGIQNPQDMTQSQQLQKLKTLFPDYNIVPEDGGKFTTLGKNGNIIEGTYDEMKTKLAADKGAKADGAGGDDDGKAKGTGSDDDGKAKGTGGDGNGKADGTGGDGNGKADGTGGDGNGKADGAGGSGATPGTTATDGKGDGRGINLEGWYRSDTKTGNENIKLGLKNCKTAEEVINKVISAENKMDFLGTADRADLTKQLIAKNPSVFNSDGTVKANANWDKLDLPSINWLNQRYVSERKDDGAQVTYKSKVSGSTVTNTSQMSGAQQANFQKNYSKNITFTETVTGSWTNAGYGKATFTDSAGKVWTFTAETTMSRSEERGIAEIKSKINEQIKAAGFTNTTLE